MSTIEEARSKEGRGDWTPEDWIQGFKELVTAALGLAVVIYTLVLANNVFQAAGEAKIADAKDILLVVQGMAGVVIGYYFGRVPADARTAQAQTQAAEATTRAARIGATAETTADKIDQLIGHEAVSDPNATRGGQLPTGGSRADLLLHIRDELRELSRLAH